MFRLRIGKAITVSFLAGLCFSGVSWGEDCRGFLGAGALTATTRPSFMNLIPGSIFVVTVAHVAPSREGAIGRGRLARCDTVPFRIDEVKVGTNGSVEVVEGERKELAPGESARFVYEVPGLSDDPNIPTDRLETYNLDLKGFKFVSAAKSSVCGVVANVLFYADEDTTAPILLAPIPGVGL